MPEMSVPIEVRGAMATAAPDARQAIPWRARLGQLRWLTPALVAMLPVLVVAAGPAWWRADPVSQDLLARLQAPSLAHPLGTDQLGRDLLARILHGGRLSLGLSLAVTAITAVVGVALGSLAASCCGGAVDVLLMRLVDILLAFPFLLVALTISGLSGGGIGGIFVALALFGWVTHARVARAETLRVRALLFVEAARSLGAAPRRVYLGHVLPSMAPPLLVVSVVRFGQTILAIAGLSFLGVGVQPPTPEWGALLSEGLPYMERAPHVLLVPGLAVSLSCLVLTLGAEGLRRSLRGG